MLELPKLPSIPKPPRISELIPRATPLHEMIGDARAVIKQGREEITGVASYLHQGVEIPSDTPSEVAPEAEKPLVDKVAQGTACNICSDEHLVQTSGDLMEAMRFARQGGLTDPEAVRRVTAARAELNEMERYDLTPAQIETLSPQERALAEWALVKSRNIRHLINTALTSRSVADLDKAAAEAERTASEFTSRVLGLPQGCPKCEKLVDLKAYLEKRKHG
ncbi:MAG: hypothetical protein Q7T57_05655 [Dehalococcoidales bacterium]|nr:hypothetical protein [Dehalococcoidales bacterium]